jgi:Domain of unknown function (DUF4926)
MAMSERPKLNDVVALLANVPAAKLLRGQVGTVVEVLARDNLLVEFADDNGRAYALAPIKAAGLLVLQYEREVA